MSTPQPRTCRAEVAQVVDDRGVRRVERPAVVAVEQRRAGARRRRCTSPRGRCPSPAAPGSTMNGASHSPQRRSSRWICSTSSPKSSGNRSRGHQRAVRLLPAVVDLEEVEAGPVAEPLAQQLRVLEQPAGADRGSRSSTRTPSRARAVRSTAAAGQQRGELLGRPRAGPAPAVIAIGSETISSPAATTAARGRAPRSRGPSSRRPGDGSARPRSAPTIAVAGRG